MFDFSSGENRESDVEVKRNFGKDVIELTSDEDIMSTATTLKKKETKKKERRIRKTFWHLLHVTRQWAVYGCEFQHTRLNSEFTWFGVLLFVWSFFFYSFFLLRCEFSFLIKTNGVFSLSFACFWTTCQMEMRVFSSRCFPLQKKEKKKTFQHFDFNSREWCNNSFLIQT